MRSFLLLSIFLSSLPYLPCSFGGKSVTKLPFPGHLFHYSVHKFTVLCQIYKQHPSRAKDLVLMPSRTLHLPWLPPRPLCMSFLLLCSYSSATLWNPQSLLPQGVHRSPHPVSATWNIVCPLTCSCLRICGLIRKVSLDFPHLHQDPPWMFTTLNLMSSYMLFTI